MNTTQKQQDNLNKQQNLMWERYCNEVMVEHRRKRRIAFGLDDLEQED